MAKLDHQSIRSTLLPQLQPGEELVHAAYGVRPPSVLFILMVAVLTAGIGGLLAGVVAQVAGKHYLVGVTRTRLILLRVSSFGHKPLECISHPLGAMASAKTQAGLIFVRIELPKGSKPSHLKFHRAAFSGNREEAIGVGRMLEAGSAGQVGGYSFAAASVVTSLGPARPSTESHLVLGLAVGAVSAMLGVALGVYYAATSDSLSFFEVLTSEWGLLSVHGIVTLGMGAAGAAGAAFVCSLSMSRSSATARGAVAGGVAYLGNALIRGAASGLLGTGGEVLHGARQGLQGAFEGLSPITLLVWLSYVGVGVVVTRGLQPKAPAPVPLAV